MKTLCWTLVDRKTGRVDPWGNGFEFQLPIFHSRAEARAFLKRNAFIGMYVVSRAKLTLVKK